MRNILLALLLANILYWMWGMYVEDDVEPGVAIIEETDLGPPMESSVQSGGDLVASVGAVLGESEETPLQAVIGRSCVSVGPFLESADADSAMLDYANQGMKTAVRAADMSVLVGHWVQIRNLASDTEANRQLGVLQAGGLTDAYLIRTDDEGLKISLGLFGDIERAEKIELQAKSLELNAEIAPRMSDKRVNFVDISLPPGKGAGGIIEEFGEEKVLLRAAATCPN